MNPLLFRAWTAAKRGDFAQAGQLYRSAGRLEAALEMFLKAGELRTAAAVERELGRIFDAAKHLSEAGEREEAADLLRQNGRFLQAAHIFADLGQYAQAAALAQEAGKPLAASQYLEQAGRYFEAGEILRGHPEHLGRAMLHFERALLTFPDVDSLDEEAAAVWVARKRTVARAFEEGGDDERAGELFEQVGDLEGAARCFDRARLYDRALNLYRQLGNLVKVDELLDRVQDTPVELRAESAAAHGDAVASARMYLQAGSPEKAAPLFEEAGRSEEAADAFRQAGEWEQAGNLYYRSERYRDAAECFRQAQLSALALAAYERAGDMAEASRMAFESGQWERAYELAPGDPDRQALVRNLQAVPEGTPERARARLLLGRAFMDLGQPDLALECLRDLPAEVAGESPWLDYVQARCHEALGMRKEAAAEFRRVLARDVEFQDARTRLKNLEERGGSHRVPPAGGNRYLPHGEVERTASGTWYEGEDSHLRGPVLIFRPEGGPPDGLPPSSIRAAFDIRHPAILGLRDTEGSGPEALLVYEPFEGLPLPRAWADAGGFRPFECLEQFRQVLQAMQEIQARGLVHGRLEASSVLVGEGGSVKVRGVGLDVLPGEGWKAYAAPEVRDSGKGSAGGDLYAAGMVLLSALIGAFPPPDPAAKGAAAILASSAPPDLPPRARSILARVLATEPQRRFISVEEVLAELDALELPPGAVISDRYEILEELGRGGMGQVFKVRDLELDEVVALKTLRGKSGMTEAAKVRFLREIKLTRKVTHPNVIRVFDMGQFRDLTFLTMEYLPGLTMSQWVRQGPGRAASLGEKVRVLTGIASGLAEAHRQGIIHRDLKPQNVILTPDGVPKLLDFGIAYVEEGAELTQDGHFVGSPKYVSPEQVQGKIPDARSDIYCFGLLAYFLLTGDDAFPGDNPTFILMRQLREVPPAPSKIVRVPPSLEKLVMRCLQKKSGDRPATILEVLGALKAMA